MTAAVFDSASLPMIEGLYAQFCADADSVGAEWKAYFLGFQAGGAGGAAAGGEGGQGLAAWRYAMAWRERGHLCAHLNPLADKGPDLLPELKAETYGLSAEEAGRWQKVYGGKAGVECGAVTVPTERQWVQDWWESGANDAPLTKQVKLALYDGLVKANGFERTMHTKFAGVKRFSVEGNDGVVPVLLRLIESAAAAGVQHVVMGMAHRGRLNVLCNVMHKPLAEMMAGFADKVEYGEDAPSSNDVKYHFGKTYKHHAENGGDIVLDLMNNPSHLEAVNPMVLGMVRALQDQGKKALPVLMHGDSAVCGQGVVAETSNLMSLAPYNVGGTIHLVINNQIGFTANPADVFSGQYCTDGFKGIGVPIAHVNADDIEACWKVVRFAWEYRQQFGKDAVVDLVGYRRWGHNEGDDPTFTQPQMYERVRPHAVPAEIYKQQLLAEGVAAAELEALEAAYAKELTEAYETGMKGVKAKGYGLKVAGGAVDTGVDDAMMRKVLAAWEAQPKGFVIHDKVGKVVEERMAMLAGEKPLNWGAAETAAYGCLLQEGYGVRMTGQDVQRGTFSHRHAVLTCFATNSCWNVLNSLGAKGAACDIMTSALSENAVLAFEYGYALGRPDKALVMWEGQFGDFANGAQVVMDQFLSSAEAKWGQMNGMALLLPHGNEGQGPEHTSARLERFLQLSAEDNWRIAYPTTPAQIFHLLRKQAKDPVKKPLVVMTPKSLLRHPAAVSTLSDLLRGAFQTVIGDTLDPKGVKKVVLCSGKIYYDLLARREADKREDVAMIRVEQLYPWPEAEIAAALKPYAKVKDVAWVQEECRNMGAWAHVREYWNSEWGYLHYVGRPASSSPAVGSNSRHLAEQKALVEAVFGAADAAKKVA